MSESPTAAPSPARPDTRSDTLQPLTTPRAPGSSSIRTTLQSAPRLYPPPTSASPAPATSQSASQSQNSPSSQPSLTPTASSANPPPSSQPPASPSSVSLPPSSSNPPASSQQQQSSNPPQSSNNPAPSTVTAPTPTPSTTDIITSVITPSPTAPGETPQASTIVITRTAPGQPNNSQPTNNGATSSSPSDTSAPGLQNPKSKASDSGLSTGGKTAIAVVVPVVVVALLVIGGILLWRRRKSKKSAEEARRKEVEEYGFNPNDDPTLPAVGMQSEMAEDQSGYRGWGNTATSSNRKASTTLTSGMTYSDSNSNPGGYQSPNSPTNAAFNDTHSGEPLMDGVGVLGAGPNANQNQNQNGVHRGTSNASSSYSAAERSDNSGEYPLPMNHNQDLYNEHNNNQGYYHASPYDPNGYGAAPPQPIIRDVSARRNTRIESPSVFPQQGNSGIAQNF
ncbi:hypothetical protein DM02DRAFT_646240 [Periconia macrospinosa]|uniref:Uncharacterized protein n=1 Tax=Periconia macrospinosa TaxID=97972 RepID=A0A2V1D746_9PLEO|nr:hypothetical protein DM02DRAFT_646240 [Periconia macrospinosa]